MEDQILAAVLRSMEPGASIDPILQNETIKVSLLHGAVRLQHEKKREIVRFLIESNLVDCCQRDESDLTACECALIVLGDRTLAGEMIAAEIATLNDLGRSFYVMIRRGSVEVFKLFLEQKKLTDEEVFVGVSNAMIELSVRRVAIEEQLEVYLQYLLVSHAHNHLHGDVACTKDRNEWRLHFAAIREHWGALSKQYGDRDYAAIDDELLYRIEAVHKHLYFIKDKRFLDHLPIMKIVFCLAVFVSIIKRRSEFELFKFVINKVNVMQYLRTICRQLRNVEQYIDELSQKLLSSVGNISTDNKQLHASFAQANQSLNISESVINKIISGLNKKLDPQTAVLEAMSSESFNVAIKINAKDQAVLRNLERCYTRTKQLYSIQKCIRCINSISSTEAKKRFSYITIPAVKRLIQVVGESIKSTKNSPNVTKETDEILSKMITFKFTAINKQFREYFSHQYSLVKMFLSESASSNLYFTINNHMHYIEMVFTILSVCSIQQISKSALGVLRRCKSNHEMQCLVEYFGDMQLLENYQQQHFDKIEQMFSKMKKTIDETTVHSTENQPHFEFIRKNFENKVKLINSLRSCLINKWSTSFKEIKLSVHGNATVSSTHLKINWMLTLPDHKTMYQNINTMWQHNHVNMMPLFRDNAKLLSIDSSVIEGVMQNMNTEINTIKANEYIEYTKQILLDLGVDDPTDEWINLLNVQLSKHYENIFLIDNKYQTLKKFFHNQHLVLNQDKLKKMRTANEQQLQQIFESRLHDMRTVLEMVGIVNVEDLMVNLYKVSVDVQMALEYFQLELCEILIATGYYGDNFNLLKHRIPFIYGRNLRNYLAHDGLSYNVLTDSSHVKLIVMNALAMINSEVKLYRKRPKAPLIKVNCHSTAEALDWINEQQMELQEAEKPNESIEIKASSRNNDSITNHRIRQALQEGNFEASFRILADHHPVKNSTLPQEFFAWDLIIDYLLTEMTDWDERDSMGRTVLHRLIQAGNHERAALLLELMPDTNVNTYDTEGLTPLDYAVRVGCPESVRLLLMNNATVSTSNQYFAIICHMNDAMPLLFADIDENLLNSQVYAFTAIRANNLHAMQYLVEQFYNSSHKHLRHAHLNACLSLAAHLNLCSILQYLSALPFTDYFQYDTLPNGNTALQNAIRKRNWKAAELLITLGASPSWTHPDGGTAFQLAVAANSTRMLAMMKDVDPRVYRSDKRLIYPVETAIKNNSTKMIRYLETVGFTMLDEGRCLQAAVKSGNFEIVQRIFKSIDATLEGDSAGESVLHVLRKQLRRWRAKAYLEEPDRGLRTTLSWAVLQERYAMVAPLLEKSMEIRQSDQQYLHKFVTYRNKKISCVYHCSDVMQNSTLIQQCDELLSMLGANSRYTHEESTLHLTFTNRGTSLTISGKFSVLNDGDLISDASFLNITESIEINTDSVDADETILEAILNRLHANITTCGYYRKDSEDALTYFITHGDSAHILQNVTEILACPIEKYVNFGATDGETPFHKVCYEKNRIDLIDLMLTKGANPLAANSVAMTPLHLALLSSDTKTVLHLLQFCVDRNLKSPSGTPAVELGTGQGFRPLHLAVISGKREVIEYLINCKVNLRAQDSLGLVAMTHCFPTRQLAIMKLLLECDPELLNIPDHGGQTPVHHSAKQNDPNFIRALLRYPNLDLRKEDNKGSNPAAVAFEFKNTQWLEVVFAFARSNRITDLTKPILAQGLQPLHYVLLYKDPDLQRIVVEYEIDAELNESIPVEALPKLKNILTSKSAGLTALHIAVRVDSQPSIKFILRCQTLYNMQSEDKLNLINDQFDAQGNSPLDYVLDSADEQLANLLLEENANKDS